MTAQPSVGNGASRGSSWVDALRVYGQPRMLSMLLLGFSAGLPFYLVFSTLSFWLRQSGIERSTIGMLAWVGLAYTFKFVWSPVVDRVPLPGLTRHLGRRRSWMVLAQIGIAVALFNLSLSDPSVSVSRIALWALFLAFCAATQDIAIDAWRIETASAETQGAMAAAYQMGYRIALLTGSAGALYVADSFGWHASYATMTTLVGVGFVTTLLSREPAAVERKDLATEKRVIAWVEANAHLPDSLRAAGAWFVGAVICPFVDFFSRYGVALAVGFLLFMSTYRLTEFTMGSMANPFYVDHGYTATQVATVVKVYGLSASIVGIVVAGIIITRLGILPSLVLGSLMIMTSNLGFAWLATTPEPHLASLGLVNVVDNLAQALHGLALITFLSGLTSRKYTATQYALFSSLYALPGKILEGFSGFVVDAVGYPLFFVYTASMSLPALAILMWLAQRRPWERTDEPDAARAPASG